MKYKQLMEEFFDYGKSSSDTFPIYKNPTKTDLSNLFKEELEYTGKNRLTTRELSVRFVADIKNKDFYIYSIYYLHDKFMNQFFQIKKESNNERFFYGIGKLGKPGFNIRFIDSLDFCGPREYIKNFKRKDLEFINKYIYNFEDIIDKYIKMYKYYLETDAEDMSDLKVVEKNLGK